MANIILSIEPSHAITKNNIVLYYGSEDDCFSKLLNIQPFSTHHSIRHEGYNITSNNLHWRSIYKTA